MKKGMKVGSKAKTNIFMAANQGMKNAVKGARRLNNYLRKKK